MKVVEKPKKIYEPEVGDYIEIKEYINPGCVMEHYDTIGREVILLDVTAKVVDVTELVEPFTMKRFPMPTVEYSTKSVNGDPIKVLRRLNRKNDGSQHNNITTIYYSMNDSDSGKPEIIEEFGYEDDTPTFRAFSELTEEEQEKARKFIRGEF